MTRKTLDDKRPAVLPERLANSPANALMPSATWTVDLSAVPSTGLALTPIQTLGMMPRRSVLRGGVGAALGSVFGSAMLVACGGGDDDAAAGGDASAQKGLQGAGGDAVSAAPPTAATFAATTFYWASTGTEQYSSTTGLATYNAVAQLTGSTPAATEAWVEIQYRNNTRSGGMIAIDTAAGVPLHTTSKYLVQLQPSGVLRYGFDNPSSLSNVGYTFPSAGVNNRLRLHLSAAGVVTIQTTVDNGANWTVQRKFDRNVSTLTSPLYWRLYVQQNHDILEPRQTGVGAVIGNGVPTTFDALYAPTFTLNSNTTYYPMPAQVMPTTKAPNLQTPSYFDQRFGTAIFQVTSVNDAFGAQKPAQLAQDYSKRQAFNSDSTLRIALETGSRWYLYDVQTNQVVQIPGAPMYQGLQTNWMPGLFGYNCDPIWSPDDPHEIWYTGEMGEGGRWYKLNVVTGNIGFLFPTFVGRLPVAMASARRFRFAAEGAPSANGRYWTFMCETDTEEMVGLLTYDRQTDAILSTAATTNKPNWVGTSNSGLYAVIGWHNWAEGLTGATAHALPMATANGTRAYPINALDGPTWVDLDIAGNHGDPATAADGRDVWVSVSNSPGETGVGLPGYDGDGWVYYRYMDTGEAYTYPTMSTYASNGGGGDGALHFCGKAYKRPGWAVANYFGSGQVVDWNDGTVFLLELGGQNRVLRLAHAQTSASNVSAYGTPNRDLTQVLFRSDRRGTSAVEQFMIGLPSWAPPKAGTMPPGRTADPVIAGTSAPGGTLTRTVGQYTGNPAPTVAGKWQRSTDAGVTWSDISGATGASYVIPAGTSNGTRYRLVEVATSTGGTISGTSNTLTVAALAAPVNTAAPSAPSTGYTDTAVVASVGTWTGNPVPSLATVWQRNIGGTWTDSAIMASTAILSPVGNWRLKVSATNSQGGPVVVYSNSVSIAVPAVEPIPSTIITFNQADGTTLEQLASAWEGFSTGYHVQGNGLVQVNGWLYDRTWLTTSSGTNQAVQVTLKAPAIPTGSEDLRVYLHSDASAEGYRVTITGTSVGLERNGGWTQASVAHGVNLATTDLTVKVTTFAGRVRVYANGSSVALIDYVDSTPLTGGHAGLSMYPSGTPSRVKISQFAYGSS